MPEVDRLTGEITGPEGKPLTYPIQGQDVDQATWLAKELGNTIRFNHATKAWHRWRPDSGTWGVDKQRDVEDRIIVMARERAAELGIQFAGSGAQVLATAVKMVRRMFDIGKVERALETLATMPGYKTDGSDWDTEPYLLGCANGVVDLRAGKLVPNLSPADSRVTKSTNIVFDPKLARGDGAEFFGAFLMQITSGDALLGRFYLQWFGYCLFGRNWEQKFLILTGDGRNGKGALTHAVRFAAGEYDAQANQGIYMKSRMGSARSSEARSDLMCLKGARLAVMSEPEGGQFNEELLKAHTGGDPIVARPLYGKEMMWEPTHTITFLTNLPPSVEDIGPAMAERILVADFRERYEGRAADTKLYEKLERAAPSILALLVQAAMGYWARREGGEPGLEYPERVVRASKAYIDSNDPLGQALVEAFVTEPGAKGQSRDLYRAYTDWHATADTTAESLSITAFSLLLQKRGFIRRKATMGNIYLGIRPKSAMEIAMADAAA